MTTSEQDKYITDQLNRVNPALQYEHAQQYGAKFGIYYYHAPDQLTANFTPIRNRKDWETDWAEFTSMVSEVVSTIAVKYPPA